MATNDNNDNLKNKQFLESSERFMQYLARNCRTKTLHSAVKNQGMNKPCFPTYVKHDDTYNIEGAHKQVAQMAQAISKVKDDISGVESYITSPELSTKHKLALITGLQRKYQEIANLYEEIIASSSLVYYAERLLHSYNITVGNPISYATKNQDLPLVTGLLQLLMSVKDMKAHTIIEMFLNQSDFLRQLMCGTLRCSNNLVSILNNFEKSIAQKGFAGNLISMTKSEVSKNFESYFEINVSSLNLQLEGFHGVLYDSAENQVHKYDSFIAHHKDIDDIHTPEKDGEACKTVFNDVIIAQTLPPKCTFICTNTSYKEQLLHTSSLLQAEIVTQREKLKNIQIDAVYALYSADVTFERSPSLITECIRGQLLAEVSDRVMIWAMDFGVFGFISASNLYLISSQKLLKMPPLTKLCVLEGLVQEAEMEEFLYVALKLLRVVLKACAHTVKSMLLFEGGESLFLLLQYPKAQIRIALLDLLLCLAEDYRDVTLFMEEKCFDKAVLRKLEYYAHVYAAGLYKCKTTTETEIGYMISILKTVMKEKKQIRTMSESERVIRVLSILNNNEYLWKDSITTLLSFLKKETAKEQIPRRSYFKQGHGKNVLHPEQSLDKRNTTEWLYTAIYTDLEDNNQQSNTSSGEAENHTVDLSTNNGLDYVIRGTMVSACPDETHAFVPVKSLKDIKEAELAQVLCGLLNNNTEGFLYFGITLSSMIDGIVLRRIDKDMFRNGIDRIMHRCLIPEMRSNSYDIMFTPVLCKEEAITDLRNHHLYIIEVRVRPMMHMVYTVYHGGKSYVRRGTETIEYPVMQKIQDIMDAEDKQIEEYIQALNISGTKNLTELAEIVKRCISQDHSFPK